MKVDLFFSEDEIFLTGEKQHQFEIFLRTELGEIINYPESGWKASTLFESQKKSRYQQMIEVVLAYARPEDLDFTGVLELERNENGKMILKGSDIVFLKQEAVGGNGIKKYEY